MRFPRVDVQNSALLAILCAWGGLAGCGNSCVVAYSVNGSGGVVVKGGNPPPPCLLNQAQGMARAAIVKTAVCQDCAPVAQVRHILVTLRGIAIHSAGEDADTGWVDLAPQLTTKPRTFDVASDSLPEVAAGPIVVPAGPYDLMRVEFEADGQSNEIVSASSVPDCGAGLSNCLIMGDGRRERLSFRANTSRIVIRLGDEGPPMLVLPNTTSELRLRLSLREVAENSSSRVDRAELQLVGEVVVGRVDEVH